jgi:hypothetical protein
MGEWTPRPKYGFRWPSLLAGSDATVPTPSHDLGAAVEHNGDGTEPDELVTPTPEFGTVTDAWDCRYEPTDNDG